MVRRSFMWISPIKRGSAGFTTAPVLRDLDHYRRSGSGVALLDFDNDGWLDIYLLNGSTVAAIEFRTSSSCRPPSQQSRWHLHGRHE